MKLVLEQYSCTYRKFATLYESNHMGSRAEPELPEVKGDWERSPHRWGEFYSFSQLSK